MLLPFFLLFAESSLVRDLSPELSPVLQRRKKRAVLVDSDDDEKNSTSGSPIHPPSSPPSPVLHEDNCPAFIADFRTAFQWGQRGIARFSRDFLRNKTHCVAFKPQTFYTWNPATALWVEDSTSIATKTLVSDFCQKEIENIIEACSDPDARKLWKQRLKTLGSTAFVHGVVTWLAFELYDPDFLDKVNMSKHFFPVFPKMVFVVATKALIPRGPQHVFTWESPETYRTELDDSCWTEYKELGQFMLTIFESFENARWMQTKMGYESAADPKEQKVFVAFGPRGGNGKGILQNLHARVLGPTFCKINPTLCTTAKGSCNVGAEKAKLLGKRKVVFSEPEADSIFRTEFLKEISGQEPIAARQLYGVPFDFTPRCVLEVVTNHRISWQDDDAWLRRLRVIIYIHYFRSLTDPSYEPLNPLCHLVDPNLESRLTEEGLFTTFLLNGIHKYHETGLSPCPEFVIAETRDWALQNNVVLLFVEANFVATGVRSKQISKETMYQAFRVNVDGLMSKSEYGKRMRSSGFTSKKHKSRAGKPALSTWYRNGEGLTLRSPNSLEDEGMFGI